MAKSILTKTEHTAQAPERQTTKTQHEMISRSTRSNQGRGCQVILRRSHQRLQLKASDWSLALLQARKHGWVPPVHGTPHLLVGEMIGNTSAKHFAMTLGGAPQNDETDEIVKFCRTGSFMIDLP